MTRQNELEAARRLRQAVERLPREVQPGRDLWPEIAGRLEARPRRVAGGGWWRLAAAMALVAAGLLTATHLRPGTPSGHGAAAGLEAASGGTLAAAHLRQRDGVLHAHSDLIAIAARRRVRLDEPGAAAMAAGLADLERATADIEAALADSPSDRRLRLALAAAYRREADWTSRFGRI